jgi:hypothetical protein
MEENKVDREAPVAAGAASEESAPSILNETLEAGNASDANPRGPSQRRLWIAAGKGNLGVIRQQGEMTWPEYREWLRTQQTTLPVTKSAYAALSGDAKAALKKDLPFSIGAQYSSEERKAANVRYRDTVNLDFDKLDPAAYEAMLAAAREQGREFLHVGSASNEVNGRRSGRLIIPLSRSVEPRLEFPAVSRKIAAKLGIEYVDPVSHRANQICYAPARCADAAQVFEDHDGEWLDVEAILAEYANYQDPAQWPRTSREQSVYSEASRLGDPREKPGLIGAFNRKYDFPTAIEAFALPYDSTGDEWRWTPHGASSSGGARLYASPNDPDFAAWMWNDHEHGLSPKRNVCAYDAVRLHQFGHFDKGLPDGAPVSELPSSRAMDEWLRTERPEVVAEAERAQFAELGFKNLEAQPGAEAPKSQTLLQEALKGGRPGRFPSIGPLEVATLPPPKWLVKKLLERAETCFLYGEYGLGKSFLALAFAIMAAFGRPFMGRRTTKCRIAYLCAESFGGFSVRLQAFEKHYGVKLADVQNDLRFIYNVPDICKMEDVADLTADLKALGPLDVVILDTWARVTAGANENAAEDMGVALNNCQAISRATGALVMAVAHPGKDPSKGLRGSYAVPSGADTLIEIVELEGGVRQARVVKQRNGECGPAFCFELTKIHLGYDEDGDEISSCVVEQRDGAAARAKMRLPATASLAQVLVYRTLRAAARGRLSTDDLAERAKRQLPRDPPGSADRRKERVHKAIEQLSKKGFIQVMDDEVSLPPDCMPTPDEAKAAAKEQAEAQAKWEALDAAEDAGAAEGKAAAASATARAAKMRKPRGKPTSERPPRPESTARNTVLSAVTAPAPPALAAPPQLPASNTVESAEPAPTPVAPQPAANGANGHDKTPEQALTEQFGASAEDAARLLPDLTTAERIARASESELKARGIHIVNAKRLQRQANDVLRQQRAAQMRRTEHAR